MVVFDSSIMLLAIRPDVKTPIDPQTNKPVEYAKERIDGLIEQLEKDKIKIIIPAPSLSELLVRAGSKDTPIIMQEIQKSPVFEIVSFDNMAAIEVSLMTRKAKENGNKRWPVDDKSIWSKVKYDRQIIAIAKVKNATAIYSDDNDIYIHAKEENLKVIKLADIPIPQKERQVVIDFKESKESMLVKKKDNANAKKESAENTKK